MSRPQGFLAGVLSPAGPTVGLDIAAAHVTAVALVWEKGSPHVLRHARAALPDGAVVPTPTALNIHDRAAVTEAIRKVLEVLPERPTRIGLTVPDMAAKVSFVQFESVPSRKADLDRLVAWQVRRSAPFRVEEAQLSYALGAKQPDGGQEFVVALVRRDIVAEYEAVCDAAGVYPGLVDLTSFNVINAATSMAPPVEADWLLIHCASEYSTLAIIKGTDLIFFRSRPTRDADDLIDLIHQTAMYYQDRLHGKGLVRTILVENSARIDHRVEHPAQTVHSVLEDRLNTSVERLGSGAAVTKLGVKPGALDVLAGPVGLLIRDRPALRVA